MLHAPNSGFADFLGGRVGCNFSLHGPPRRLLRKKGWMACFPAGPPPQALWTRRRERQPGWKQRDFLRGLHGVSGRAPTLWLAVAPGSHCSRGPIDKIDGHALRKDDFASVVGHGNALLPEGPLDEPDD